MLRIKRFSLFLALLTTLLIFILFFSLFINLSPKWMRTQMLKAMSLTSKLLLKIIDLEIIENPLSDKANMPRVIVANHVSYLDIIVLLARSPSLFLAKSEVSKWPLIGPIAKGAGVIFVNRKFLKTRALAIPAIQEKIRDGHSVVIFPEGTTTALGPRKNWIPFFQGAFRIAREERLPLEAVFIDYEDTSSCAWLGNDAFITHLWSLMNKKNLKVRVRSSLLLAPTNHHRQREYHRTIRNWMLDGAKGVYPLKEPAPF